MSNYNIKKATNVIEDSINKEDIKYAGRSEMLENVETKDTSNCFITFDNHKKNFVNLPTTVLIDPTKNETGGISKLIFYKMSIG